MTTTMVERTPRGRRLPRRALLPVLLGLAFAPCSRADVTFTPSVQLKQTWTDNVTLRPDDEARRELVTEVSPGFALAVNNARVQMAARYQLHKYFYSDEDVENLRGSGHNLQADLRARMVDDMLFLDASASRGQQSVSAFGPGLADNQYSTFNRTEVSTWRISPYLSHRFGSAADLLARYTRDSVETGRDGFGNTKGDSINLVLSSPAERRIGWNLRYDRQELSDRLTGDSSSYSGQAGLTWRVLAPLLLSAGGGYDKYDYQALGGSTGGSSWNVGYQYTPSPRTSLSMSFGQRYFGKSRAMSALHRSRHTVWNISYDESVTTTRSQFLLPATVDTFSLLDSLFAPNFPDPAQRRLAIETYLRATGLPTSLANDVNYLSNRYFLQQQFQASVGFTGSRSVLLLSVHDTRRNALSIQQSDSPLLGSSQANLNDDTRQRGVNVNASYRLSPRSSLFATANTNRSRSVTTGVEQHNRGLRLGMQRQFQRGLLGSFELRRLQGSSGRADRSYTENAVSATLSMTL